MCRLQEVCAGQTFVQLFIIFNSRDQQKHCPSGTHIDEGSGPCEVLPIKSPEEQMEYPALVTQLADKRGKTGGCGSHRGCKDMPSGRRLDEFHVGKSYRAEKSSAQITGEFFFHKQK